MARIVARDVTKRALFWTWLLSLQKTSPVRACVIFNPAAKGQKAERFRGMLDSIAAEYQLKKTAAPRDARRLAAEAIQEGFDTVIAAGGDGTLNEVLNGIGDVPDGFEHACLGVLPLGTINVFARELGIPLQPDRAWTLLRQMRERRIDLPCIQIGGEQPQQIYFAQLAGAGLDARAIELVDWPMKKKLGAFAYVLAGLKAMRTLDASITVSDGVKIATGGLILIGNGKLYGGPFKIFPDASLSDGYLDVCVFPKVNWGILFRCGFALLTTRKLPETVVVRLRTKSFSITSGNGAMFEVDGELAGALPVSVQIKPAALRVLAP